MRALPRILKSSEAGFQAELNNLLSWEEISDAEVVTQVSAILQAVRASGDAAVCEFTNRFDRREASSLAELELQRDQLESALASISSEQREMLQRAADRIREYHSRQLAKSWTYRDEHGNLLGQQINPIAKAGIYVPGGKAAYPSSVLMNAIPAQVAGVEEIVMVSPVPAGEQNDLVLAAAAIAGVDRCFTIGGAQAVAAMAYGTESIPRVDKIVGPGNIYVATAKKLVYGQVGIDMIAGPSEILVVSDGKTPADWIAMDLFSQAEHDESAQAVLITWDESHLNDVLDSMQRLLPKMERAEIIAKSLSDRGALVLVSDCGEALALVNQISPEHLELSIDCAEEKIGDIRNAGAIFLGRHTPEAIGDYCAGPNHVLPTSTTARFSSPLGVYDFQKRSSIIGCSQQGGAELAQIASVLARGEGLTAHAMSAEYRVGEDLDA